MFKYLCQSRAGIVTTGIAGVAVAVTVSLAPSGIAQDRLQATVFIGPHPQLDSIQMAESQGFLDEEGLDITFRIFPSGTTALQTFQTGEGDIVNNGDLPGVNHWIRVNKDYRLISLYERNFKGYRGTALNEIKEPKDLIGKTIATRVGSTGSWFISEYLGKNGIEESQVEVINLDTNVLPTALCQGDVAAIFIWEPFGTRALEVCPDKVHTLTDAEGYINGYGVLGARPEWLNSDEGREIATRFLRATIKGGEFAKNNFEAVAAYHKEKNGLSEEQTKVQWELNNRIFGFDEVFMQDYCSLAAWMRKTGLMKGKFDIREFIWTDGIESIDPSLIAAIPDPC
jgi:ABC-type nitrate/sulfonate/bicarbonate transport system substrate-binding protein